MTDLPPSPSIPSQLGARLSVEGETLVAHLFPRPEICTHGMVRASALVFLVDVVAGLAVDTDPDAWTFTSDLSLRIPAIPAPPRVDAVAGVLREGRRSVTIEVGLVDESGAEAGYALVGFAKIARRTGDPEKPDISLHRIIEGWKDIPVLDTPLREAVGVMAIDPARGIVELEIRPDLLNPAGALQGAMVSLVAEAAAEDLASHAFAAPQVVTDMDIRFVAQARAGLVRSRASFIGPPSDGSVRVDLSDVGRDRVVTSVLARTRPVL